MKLPDALQRNLADAELVVVSWAAESDELILRLDEEIGPTSGLLTFRGVFHVNLPPTLTLQAIELHTAASVPNDFWTQGAPFREELGDSEHIYLMFGAWGGRFYVIAEEVSYEPAQ